MSYFSPIVAVLITMLVIMLTLSGRFRTNIQDIPNERSLHSIPTPRIGGIGLVVGIYSGWGLMLASLTWWLVAPFLGLFVVSVLDDIHNLSVGKRLLAHLSAAAILVIGAGVAGEHGLLVAFVFIFCVVWMTNLYNFMDGSDGLAGGMAFFGFASYGIAALCAHDDVLAWANLTVAAAALGFLFFNFQPAKIFMGDSGSIPLGFLAAGMGLWGFQHGDWTAWFPLIVFSPFIADASVTLVKRTLNGSKITEAHREHYYQRAIQMGAGHRNVALFEYVLMLGAGVLALASREQVFPWQSLLICLAIYAFCMFQIDLRWKKSELGSA